MSVARLQLGQRVFVLRDWSGGEVGAWGSVIRECWGKAHAWVKLDARHALCPFPANVAGRETWILTVPGCCSSVDPGVS